MATNLTNGFISSCLILSSVLVFCACTSGELQTLKTQPGDPFEKTIVASEIFTISSDKTEIVEGSEGTLILFPEGCFIDEEGQIVTGPVQIELAEALSLEKMILSNLTTISNGKLLETDGMIYWNATANGQQLSVNPDKPVYIEIPTAKRKPGMMAYFGERDAEGNMNWVDPQELLNSLVTVDLEDLDFLPAGFEEQVAAGLPFRKHKSLSAELVDSLYYSFSVYSFDAALNFPETDLNEPYYNPQTQREEGRYTGESYNTSASRSGNAGYTSDTVPRITGIDPAIIKTLKSDKFQNTLIATREFESRLQSIFKTCRDEIIEIYIKNLDKDLWELDSMAASKLAASNLREAFENYAGQKLTNVEGASEYAREIREYYSQQLKKVKEELKVAHSKLQKARLEKTKEAEDLVKNYRQLLFKREKHRMEKYGFQWSRTGWINIDKGTVPKDWGPQTLTVDIENAATTDQVYVYMIFPSLQSIYRLNSTNQQHFYVGNATDKQMLMPKLKPAAIFAVGYQAEQMQMATANFITGEQEEVALLLKPSTKEAIAAALAPYDDYKQENSIAVDLDYMSKFAKEKQRQESIREEAKFLSSLWKKAYPCEDKEMLGKQLLL